MRRHRKYVWLGVWVAYLSDIVHRVPKAIGDGEHGILWGKFELSC